MPFQLKEFKPHSSPVIRWAGSKRKLLKELVKNVPEEFGTYYEPFAGSACLFFAINPQKSVISDLNGELIESYRIIRDEPIAVCRAAQAFDNTREGYYQVRALNLNDLDSISKAARFIFLNRFCFNGLYRTNKKGQFNVPYGSRTGSIQSEEEFVKFAEMLSRADLRNDDFEKAISDASRDDFVYLDPPYVYTERKDRNEYGNGCFSVNDIPRLLSLLEKLHGNGVKFLLSYLAVDEFLNALPGEVTNRLSVRRNIAGFAGARRNVEEVLIVNDDLFGNE